MQVSHQKIAYDSETFKLQPVNQSETSRHTAGIHQRAVDSLRSF